MTLSPSAADDDSAPDRFHCKYTVTNRYNSSYCSSPESHCAAFTTATLLFLDEVKTDEWTEVKQFAALVRAHSSLCTREIAGLLGIAPETVPQESSAGDPPWQFAHPTLDETVHIRRWSE